MMRFSWCALPLLAVSTSILAAQPRTRLKTPGLRAPVSLTRDSAGIVHIDAKNEHDLFFAQGYSAARDRLFQLELWRRQATGTMAEALGPRWVARDRASRLLAFRGSMTQELAHYHPRGAAIVQAFVDGINAYVRRVRAEPSLLPLDLAALGIVPGYWTPAVVVSRHNALANNASDEAGLARAVRLAGAETIRRRRRFEGGPTTLQLDSLVAQVVQAATDAQLLADYNGSRSTPSFRRDELIASWQRAGADSTASRDADRWESNNWVISGARTASGKPLVANDPHRAITTPSLRYLVHLKAPGWDVIGGGEPAIPGVAIGHNRHGAWGLTVFAIDAEDLYVYELDADNRRYRYRGGYEPFRVIRDSIRVKGGASMAVALRYTRHGPVLYVDSAQHRAVALRAGWLEVGGAPYLASLRLDQARNWTEARAALAFARMPALNWIWGDTSGTIGWQTAGAAPVRRTWDGLLPVPGDGRFEWDGLLPIPQLPHETNPTRGYVGTANAFNVAPTYGHFEALGRGTWADPYRHNRLQEVLDTTRRATVEASGALQHDAVSLIARALVPLASRIAPANPLEQVALDTLRAWNHTLTIESRGAAIYAAWERRLTAAVTDRVLPGPLRQTLRSVPVSRVVQYLTAPDTVLSATPTATRDSLLQRTFAEAVTDVARRFGRDITAWRYGDTRFHHARIAHVLDPLVTDSLRSWLTPGPAPRGGYANTLLASGNSDNQTAGASMRVVIDVADWERAIASNTPGQSGDPRSPFYANLFTRWAANQYVPLPYSTAAIAARTYDVMVLTP